MLNFSSFYFCYMQPFFAGQFNLIFTFVCSCGVAKKRTTTFLPKVLCEYLLFKHSSPSRLTQHSHVSWPNSRWNIQNFCSLFRYTRFTTHLVLCLYFRDHGEKSMCNVWPRPVYGPEVPSCSWSCRWGSAPSPGPDASTASKISFKLLKLIGLLIDFSKLSHKRVKIYISTIFPLFFSTPRKYIHEKSTQTLEVHYMEIRYRYVFYASSFN